MMRKLRVLFGVISICVVFGAQPDVLSANDKRIEKIEKKLSRLPEKGRRKTKALLRAELGTLLYKKGNWEKAASELETALEFKTNRSLKRHIYRYLGKSYESYGRMDKAIGAYEKAVQYDPKNWRRHRDVARLYENVRLYRKAIESYEAALKRNRKEPRLYLSLGRTWRKLGIYKNAEDNLLEARQLKLPESELARELSYVYEGQSRFSDALVSYEKGLKADSPAKAWARFIYLAVLAKNKTFANQGMDELRKKNVTDGTLPFYESLVQRISTDLDELLKQKKTDPTLQSLITLVQEN